MSYTPSEREAYEKGRSDGFAECCAIFQPALEECRKRLSQG